MAPSTLYDLENGGQQSSTKLHLLADVLKTTPHWLETGKGSPDAEAKTEVREIVTIYGKDITPDGVRLAQEWEKLDDEWKAQIVQLVDMLVAKKKRDERKKPVHPDPRPTT